MNGANYFLRKEESLLLLNKERTVTIEKKKTDRKKYSLKLPRFRIILSLTYRAKERQSCL